MEAINNVQNKTRFTPKFIASVGILSGISIVLMQILEFPIPFMPPFLKFDFSTLPALIGGFAYGPRSEEHTSNSSHNVASRMPSSA